ncbi:hypothetical protein L210DRAFT_823270, partial [Boletus edulis BED1]
GLYCVEHTAETGSANAAERRFTVMKLHCCMGHIGAEVVKQLVSKGFITGIQLVPSGSDENIICESCITAKAKRHPEHEGSCSMEYGGEIHSDLWGPAPVKSL